MIFSKESAGFAHFSAAHSGILPGKNEAFLIFFKSVEQGKSFLAQQWQLFAQRWQFFFAVANFLQLFAPLDFLLCMLYFSFVK